MPGPTSKISKRHLHNIHYFCDGPFWKGDKRVKTFFFKNKFWQLCGITKNVWQGLLTNNTIYQILIQSCIWQTAIICRKRHENDLNEAQRERMYSFQVDDKHLDPSQYPYDPRGMTTLHHQTPDVTSGGGTHTEPKEFTCTDPTQLQHYQHVTFMPTEHPHGYRVPGTGGGHIYESPKLGRKNINMQHAHAL